MKGLHPFARRRLAQAGTLLAVLLALTLGTVTPAAAQGFGWLGGIFGGGGPPPRQQRTYPSYPGYGSTPRRQAPSYGWGFDGGPSAADDYPPPPRRRHRAPPRPKDVAEPAPPPKTDATNFVYVFGDSMGQMLANGLDDALGDRPEVGVVHAAKGSTGLVTTDFYDWPKTIDELVASQGRTPAKAEPPGTATKTAAREPAKPGAPPKEPDATSDTPTKKIDVAVMMVGTNDRQPITEGGKTYPFESDEWTAIYRKRVMAIDEAFARHGIPLIWVGLPITHDSGFANDMAALNDIYRDAAAKTGAVFVDTWEAFSDENGDFSAYGPDINGQTVRLRSADGIHFTRAGARKLAHFVEAHVRRALDGKVPPVELPTGVVPSAGPAAHAPAVAAVKPDAGPITNLNEPVTASSGELAAAAARPRTTVDALVETSLERGAPSAPPKGRADDFRWPQPATPTAGTAPVH